MMELVQWLEQEEEKMVECIRRLVEIPSVAQTGRGSDDMLHKPYGQNCSEVLCRMLELGETFGFQSRNYDGYCGSLSFGEGETECGIWGHLDVVPAGEGWIYEPFTCLRKGDYLIGRGVRDNKGPLIAALWALRYLKESGFSPPLRFRLIFGCAEECGMDDVAYYLSAYPAPDFSIVADCGFPVCHGEKGICRMVLRSEPLEGKILDLSGGNAPNSVPAMAKAVIAGEKDDRMTICSDGISGHAAAPEGTKNAVYELSKSLLTHPLADAERRIVEFLRDITANGYGAGIGIDCEDMVSGRLTCNMGMVSMEDGVVKLSVDIRYPIFVSVDPILEKIRIRAKQAGLTVDQVENDPPAYVSKDHWLVELLTNVYEEKTGERREAYTMGGGTYARKVPCAVGFGPGFPEDTGILGLPEGHGGAHSADEAQSLSDLKKAVEIYVQAFCRIGEYVKMNQSVD